MAYKKASNAKMTVDNKEYGFWGIDFSHTGNSDYTAISSPDFNWSFTGQISEEDSRKLYQFFTGRYLPSLYQRWLYHRSILNPKHTKYRAYLRGAR